MITLSVCQSHSCMHTCVKYALRSSACYNIYFTSLGTRLIFQCPEVEQLALFLSTVMAQRQSSGSQARGIWSMEEGKELLP